MSEAVAAIEVSVLTDTLAPFPASVRHPFSPIIHPVQAV
jgi:hypothetical protein